MQELLAQSLALLTHVVDLFLHLDVHLNAIVVSMGGWTYLILFAIVFCETGLVVTPFLPGDSLLFATGALAASAGSPLDLSLLMVMLIAAALMGDIVNYTAGKHIGPKIFKSDTGKWLNKNHLNKTQSFYEKYGVKTIVLARFMPIVRTFAPFVAGIGQMQFRKFATFSVIGAVTWVCSFLSAGYYFGNIPGIKSNFHYVIVAIVVISVMPAVIEYIKHRQATQPKPRNGHST